MNKKKLILILTILIIVGVIICLIVNNITIEKNTNEAYKNYTPQEEISDTQSNQTSIVLYFLDKETQQIKSESKLIVSNELLQNPYKTIVENLLAGPKGENLESVFPENTRLLDASLSNNCVVLNFSEELLNIKDDTQKYNIINCMLNSLAQLNEVNSIKFFVNNEPSDKFNEEYSINS